MKPITKIVIFAGLHFLILFTAGAFQNIFTKVQEERGNFTLGPFLFICNYLFFMISNLFVPLIRYSSKWLVCISALGYSCNYFTAIFSLDFDGFMQYFLASIGSSIAGVFASVLWVNIGIYIHDACHFYNDIEKKGHYFGLFTTLYSFSLITGALSITFGLSFMSEQNYFILLGGIAVFAFIFSSIFMKNIKPSQQKKQIKQLKIKEILLSTLRYYPNMISILGMIFIDGLNIGVQASTLLRLVPITHDKKKDLLYSGFCSISSGLGAFFGGYLGGKLCDKFGVKLISTISIYLNITTYALILVASFFQQLQFALVVSFIFGFQFYFLQGCLLVICSRVFNGNPESFAIVKQFHCFSFVVFEVVAMTTQNSIQIKYIMICLIVFCIPALIGIRKLPQNEQKESLLESDSNHEI